MSNAIHEVIEVQSGSLPLYLRSLKIEVYYRAGMFPSSERQETIEEAFAELQKAIQLGFFCWDCYPTREAAKIFLEWKPDDRMTVHLSCDGVHYNALVASVRLIINLHHTNRETYESLKALLGDGIEALPKPTTFLENVASLVIAELTPLDQRVVATKDVLNYVEEAIIVPEHASLQGAVNDDFADPDGMELERLIITSPTDAAFPPKHLKRIEDYFLRLTDSGVFTSIDKLDRRLRDEEAEISKRKRGEVTQLLFGDFQQQKYGVVEFLNVVSGGDNGRLVVCDESDS